MTDYIDDLVERLDTVAACSNSLYAANVATDAKARIEAQAAEIAALRAKLAEARAERDEARKKLNACNWYWPEDDTSSDMCGESAQEIVQNAYDWTPEESGDVVAVARGGIVAVTYCASLPPAEDADSDDDFWVEEATYEAAQAKIDAEKARRAALSEKAP